MIFRAVVFTFIPTAIELVLVSWLLARSFSPSVAGLVIATFVAYVAWTTLMTKVSPDGRAYILAVEACPSVPIDDQMLKSLRRGHAGKCSKPYKTLDLDVLTCVCSFLTPDLLLAPRHPRCR